MTSGFWWALIKTAFHCFLWLKLFTMSSSLQWWLRRRFDNLFTCNELVTCQTWRLQQLQSQSYCMCVCVCGCIYVCMCVCVCVCVWGGGGGDHPRPLALRPHQMPGLISAKGSGKLLYKSSGLCFTSIYFDKIK